MTALRFPDVLQLSAEECQRCQGTEARRPSPVVFCGPRRWDHVKPHQPRRRAVRRGVCQLVQDHPDLLRAICGSAPMARFRSKLAGPRLQAHSALSTHHNDKRIAATRRNASLSGEIRYGGRHDTGIRHSLPELRQQVGPVHAGGRLPVLLRLQALRRPVEAEGWRLLRVLLLRDGAVPPVQESGGCG